jgi:hypothetical protein
MVFEPCPSTESAGGAKPQKLSKNAPHWGIMCYAWRMTLVKWHDFTCELRVRLNDIVVIWTGLSFSSLDGDSWVGVGDAAARGCTVCFRLLLLILEDATKIKQICGGLAVNAFAIDTIIY